VHPDELPRTFREACKLVNELGYQFLWIDSLCIYQDSEQDWLEESTRMSDVYSNSALNIAAGAAADSDGGLYSRRNSLTLATLSTSFSCPCTKERAVLIKQFDDAYASSELIHRGWVVQEMLLPPRVVFFNRDEILWTCNSARHRELRPKDDESFGVYDKDFSWRRSAHIHPKTLSSIPNVLSDLEKFSFVQLAAHYLNGVYDIAIDVPEGQANCHFRNSQEDQRAIW